jgi:hypothetical protein
MINWIEKLNVITKKNILKAFFSVAILILVSSSLWTQSGLADAPETGRPSYIDPSIDYNRIGMDAHRNKDYRTAAINLSLNPYNPVGFLSVF